MLYLDQMICLGRKQRLCMPSLVSLRIAETKHFHIVIEPIANHQRYTQRAARAGVLNSHMYYDIISKEMKILLWAIDDERPSSSTMS
jgi:hypothetical protein